MTVLPKLKKAEHESEGCRLAWPFEHDFLAGRVIVDEGVVEVRVEKGWVSLTGTVELQFPREATYKAVHKLSGGVGMTNSMVLNARVHAPDVKARILAALKRDAEFEADKIKVDMIGDKVILDGTIRAGHEYQVAERAPWSAAGVSSVEGNRYVAWRRGAGVAGAKLPALVVFILLEVWPCFVCVQPASCLLFWRFFRAR